MQGDVEAHKQKVRLQLCATTATSSTGQPLWSSPVQLDALGGAAVVEAPCPITTIAASHREAQAGYQLAVTAVQVSLLTSSHFTAATNCSFSQPFHEGICRLLIVAVAAPPIAAFHNETPCTEGCI